VIWKILRRKFSWFTSSYYPGESDKKSRQQSEILSKSARPWCKGFGLLIKPKKTWA